MRRIRSSRAASGDEPLAGRPGGQRRPGQIHGARHRHGQSPLWLHQPRRGTPAPKSTPVARFLPLFAAPLAVACRSCVAARSPCDRSTMVHRSTRGRGTIGPVSAHFRHNDGAPQLRSVNALKCAAALSGAACGCLPACSNMLDWLLSAALPVAAYPHVRLCSIGCSRRRCLRPPALPPLRPSSIAEAPAPPFIHPAVLRPRPSTRHALPLRAKVSAGGEAFELVVREDLAAGDEARSCSGCAFTSVKGLRFGAWDLQLPASLPAYQPASLVPACQLTSLPVTSLPCLVRFEPLLKGRELVCAAGEPVTPFGMTYRGPSIGPVEGLR